MLEARIHGLGGQGVVQTAHLVGHAAVIGGRRALSFPFFSTAIRGGLVTAFVRISDAPVDNRSYVYEPDFLAAFDIELLRREDVVSGLRPHAMLLVNGHGAQPDVPPGFQGEVFSLDAGAIAKATLGRAILSTVMAGAVARVTADVKLDDLLQTIEETFAARLVEANLEAARAGFTQVEQLMRN